MLICTLDKNLSNFLPQGCKLDNPCYHNAHERSFYLIYCNSPNLDNKVHNLNGQSD